MSQPNSPGIGPVPTSPDVSSPQASPPSSPQLPSLPTVDDLPSLDDNEPTSEDDPRSKSPHRASPALWVVPTSGELAFLASLPNPTVDFDQIPVQSGTGNVPPGAERVEEQTHSADDTAGQLAPAIEPGQALFAAARTWKGGMKAGVNKAALYRRDNWAAGDRWVRHMRIIEVGDGNLRDTSRKESS